MKLSIITTVLLATSLELLACSTGNSRRHSKSDNEQAAVEDSSIELDGVESNSNSDKEETKHVVKVFVENSGSMHGYLKGNTAFENIIFDYLTNINMSQYAEKIETNYINSEIIPIKKSLNDFIKLEPAGFRMAGGNTGATDIAEVINKVMGKTTGNDVSILISDFLISPGRGMNASEYVDNQQTKIKGYIADYIRSNDDGAVLIYQFMSAFRGTYYNIEDKQTNIDSQRPFYMFIFGNTTAIQSLRKNIPEDKFAKYGGVKNICMISAMNKQVEYSVVYGSGDFERSKKDTKHSIQNAKLSGFGKDGGMRLQFAVKIDRRGLLLDDAYLLDKQNYTISPDYRIDNISKIGDGNIKIMVSSPHVSKKTVEITLISKLPQWVVDCNDEVGIDINADGAMEKTFGIRNIIEGINEAYTYNSKEISKMSINVNK